MEPTPAGRIASCLPENLKVGVEYGTPTKTGTARCRFRFPPARSAQACARILCWGEDCLVLNVFTPGLSDGKKRPVMFWIHGGGYNYSSGTTLCADGTNLARTGDVVVVCVNHRLNLFGYLFLGNADKKYATSGNNGQLDLVAALEWVRDNAVHFGGDPGNVTIFGQSGGGGKVTTLMAMPAAKGLFHRAIIESGSTLKELTAEEAQRNTDKFLAALGMKLNQAELQHPPPINYSPP